ncbi:MAG TPA: bZIP transcription factor [Dehalococcoidia bacterium]
MNNWTKTFSVILVVGGALMIAAAIVAHRIGPGSPGISVKQVLLGLAGIGTLLVGLELGIRRAPKVRLFLGRHAKQFVIATLVVVLICGPISMSCQVSNESPTKQIESLTKQNKSLTNQNESLTNQNASLTNQNESLANDALLLLKETISTEYPETRNGQLDDWEKVKLLRQWAHEHVDWGSECTLMSQEQYRKFSDADAPTEFAMFLKDECAVWCLGTAWALMRLYEAYGYEAYCLGVGIPGGMTHAMTLVRISHNGSGILTVQDATFDISYVNSNGEPYDYFDLLTVVKNRRHDLVEIEHGPCKPGDFLLCTDEEPGSQYWWVPDNTPVPALSEGRMKVRFEWTMDNFWDFYGPAIADSLAEEGYPPHWCYMFLHLLYIRHGNEDATELMNQATSILGQNTS